MNNDRLETIRARCEASIAYTYDLNTAMKIRDDCLELLEALHVETKRAEALERAIKRLPHRATNAACHICRHQAKPDKLMCGNPGGGCQNGDYVGWQFDEARFAGGGEQP